MPQIQLDAYEKRALADGGAAGGAYLDGIGTTDVAALEPEQWEAFLDAVLIGYSDALRAMIDAHEAPF